MEENVVVSEKIVIKSLSIKKDEEENGFVIPLPQGISAEQVSIENKYILQELWVSIAECETAFFEQQWISGDTDCILSGTYEVRKGRVVLKLLLYDIYECKNLLENGKLHVEPVQPHTQYDKIVVIDPLSDAQKWETVKGGISESDVAIDIAKKLQAKFAGSDIKVYFTRLDGTERSLQLREHFVENLQPDFVLCIGTNVEKEEGAENYGVEAWYNTYFTPDVSAVKLADDLVKEVAANVVGRGNGVWECDESQELLLDAKAPAVTLRVGYLSNEKERELLLKEEYRTKIADGVYNAILNMFVGEEKDDK